MFSKILRVSGICLMFALAGCGGGNKSGTTSGSSAGSVAGSGSGSTSATSTATTTSTTGSGSGTTSGASTGSHGSTGTTGSTHGSSGSTGTTSSTTTSSTSGGSTGGVHVVAVLVSPSSGTLATGRTLQLQAFAVSSDGSSQDVTSTATWTSSDDTVLAISNAGLATAGNAGPATITATVGTLDGTAQFTVDAAALVRLAITGSPALALGTSESLVATGFFSDNNTQPLTSQVNWTSSDSTVASVGNGATAGEVTAVAVGPVVITATDAASGLSATFNVVVTNATLTALDIAPDQPTIALGTHQAFTATGHFSDGSSQDLTRQVNWASDDTSVATIDAQGLATSVTAGTTNVSAALAGVTHSTILTVSPAALVSIALSPAALTLAKGNGQTFTAMGTLSDGNHQDLSAQVQWLSSDDTVATVDNTAGNEGHVLGVSHGTVTITATDAASGVSGTAQVDVTDAVLVQLTVNPSANASALPQGETAQFTAVGTYSDGSTADITSSATWTSDADTTASVSSAAGSRGLVTAVNTGTTSIHAVDPTSGVGGFASVTVAAPEVVSLAITPANGSAPKGTSPGFHANATYSDGNSSDVTTSVTWGSSDPTVLAFSTITGEEGKANALTTGNVTVTASLGSIQAQVPFAVVGPTLVSITVGPSGATLAKGTELQLTATGSYTDGSSQDITSLVQWQSADNNVLTVSNSTGTRGVATAHNTGPVQVTATDPVSTLFGTLTVNVSPATVVSITVSPVSGAIAQNATINFTASATFSDSSVQDVTTTANWVSSVPAVATISNNSGTHGRATGVGPGTTQITAAQGGVTSANAPLTVSAVALVSIVVTPNPAVVNIGTPVQLTATGNYNDGSTANLSASATWFSSDTSKVTVSNTGMATRSALGTVTVYAISGSVSGSTSVTSATATHYVLNPLDTGWYNAGSHSASNKNWAAGGGYHDYFVFDLSTVAGPVNSAVLSMDNPCNGGATAGTMVLFDVSTPIATLEADASGANATTTDLASGTQYGSVALPSGSATPVTVPFNASGTAALQAGEGAQFAIGGDYAADATQWIMGCTPSGTPTLTIN